MKQKLYTIAILSGLFLTAALSGRAQTLIPGTSLSWQLSGTTFILTGEGTMPPYTGNDMPWYPYGTINTIEIQPDGPMTIGSNAFNSCTSIVSVNMEDGVTYIGEGAFAGCESLTSVHIPASVTAIMDGAFNSCPDLVSVNMEEGLTVIGEYAFDGCAGLTSVHIPASVTTIGEGAFAGTGLTSVTIPANVTTIEYAAFANCASLASVVIPTGVTTIGEGAFSGTGLTSVNIPASVTTIGDQAFGGCTSLASIHVDGANPNYTSIDGVLYNKNETALLSYPGAKTGMLTLPAGVTAIGDRAFAGTGITSINIPDGVTAIGDYAFAGCESLTSVHIPASVTTFGERAFAGCTSLASVDMAEGLTVIGEGAFDSCGGLTSVNIPTSVTTIGNQAFASCTNITSINIPSGVTTIGDEAFGGTGLISVNIPASVTAFGIRAFAFCPNLVSVNIAEGVETIGEGLFFGCTSLASVDIPASVKTIEFRAFNGCSSLSSVDIPEGVETIGGESFRGCQTLSSIHIPASVKTIGVGAFASCPNLAFVYMAEGVETIGNNAFSGCMNLSSIHIPAGVTKIEANTFAHCTSLTSINIPASVTTVESNAFDCMNLEEIAMHWTDLSAVAIHTNAFNNMPMSDVTLYVPPGTEAAYAALGFFTGAKGILPSHFVTATVLYGNGAATASPSYVPVGKPAKVTLTFAPATGYEPDEALAFKTGDRSTPVALAGTGLARTFAMPDCDVTAEVTFRPTRFEMPPSVITGMTLLTDTTSGGVPVVYALDPRSAAYARLDGNRLTPLRDGEIRITASAGASLPTTAYILYISLPLPPATRRTVVLPAVSGAVTDPPAGRHSVVSGEDFVFTLTPAPGSADFPAVPVVSTGRTDEPDGIVTDNGDGSYTVRIPAIRQAVTLRIDIEAPAALDATAADRVLSAGSQLRITASAPGEAHVYTLTGARIKTLRYPAGETVATLPAGHYVVVAGGKVYRIIIR